MLTELRIVNFAVLEQLTLSFQPGFTILTGETGAGKSLLIDAIALLVGARASTDQIRFGAEEAHLEAAFDLPARHPLLARLRDQGLLGAGESQLIVRRVLSRSGRHRVYLNGSLTPLHALEELGGTLVDIHGQHDQQSLLATAAQLEAVDAFGDLGGLRAQYEQAYDGWFAARRRRDELAAQIREWNQRGDLLRFQQQELEEADLRMGEEEALRADRRRLGASQRLGELTADAQDRLHADNRGVLPNLASIERAVAELAQIDSELDDAKRMAEEARVLVKEVAARLRDYADHLDADPARLTAVDDRLSLIQTMKKKYGDTVEAVLDAYRRIQDEVRACQTSDQTLEELDRLIGEQRRALDRIGGQLTAKRTEAAKRMAKAVRVELEALKMGQTKFGVRIVPLAADEGGSRTGMDRAEFLLSTNQGEPLKPLARVASGGELSRVMLALKTVLAEGDRVPVLIFDEIDTGVGGAVAAAIGKRLRVLGRLHQVFCITHLPQVASQAGQHLCVEKTESGGRTTTSVRALQGIHRENEIARMLGGLTVTKKIRETAAELIAEAAD